MAVERLVEGWTKPLRFQILADGLPMNATGTTVALVLKDKAGAVIDTVGDAAWENEAEGIVAYTPDATDLKAADSPCTAHWKITDVSGAVIFAPKGEPDTWIISKQ